MGELVDKQAVLRAISELSFVGYLNADDIHDAVEWLPVVEERKKGEWIPDPPEGSYQLYKCSVCGYLWPYWYASATTVEEMTKTVLCCPKCYADMREEKTDEKTIPQS